MMPETTAPTDWTRVKALFASTFEAGPEERSRLLLAETEERIRRRVEAMLLAHDEAEGPLDKSVLESVDSLDLTLVAASPTLVGRKLGPYRVTREIGVGGMGTVYEAVRADDQFEQRVAIKTLRVGRDSSAVVKRFNQERRILAALQHPHIAALYDGGITEDGLPYFVLELVDGIPIDRYCNEHALDIRRRIELFLQVLGAVQHAHQQLIVHRDIKPGNILVTRTGVVKLVDFGIAKLLDDQSSQVTRDLIAPLTLNYASPEQVKGEAITTASDVYSLGVVLYRLLAGATPLSLEDLSLDRAVSTLCATMPPAPSVVVTADAAHSMSMENVDRLRKALRGDIDAILLTALRKEPERRYATVRELGDDLERYLGGKPVAAVPDSLSYRIGKFVRRQRAAVIVGVVAILSVVAGGISTLWQARTARIEAQRAAAVSKFLQSVIGAGDLRFAVSNLKLGPSASVGELLDSAASRLTREQGMDPHARAQIHIALGQGFVTQEKWNEAETQYQFALKLSDAAGKPTVETANALVGLAVNDLVAGRDPRAKAGRALSIYEQLGRTTSAEYARSLRVIALSDALEGNYTRADSLFTQARLVYSRIRPSLTVEKAFALADQTAVREGLGLDRNVAIASYRRALAMIDSVRGDFAEKADILWYAARAETMAGDQRKADSLALEALHVAERVSGGSNSGTVAQQLTQLATIARIRGDTAAQGRYIERAARILAERPHMIALVRERLQSELAQYRMSQKRLESADSLARAVYLSRARTNNLVYLVDAEALYARVLMERKRFAEAVPILLNGFDLSSRSKATAAYRDRFAQMLVQTYQRLGQQEKANEFLARIPASVQKKSESRQ